MGTKEYNYEQEFNVSTRHLKMRQGEGFLEREEHDEGQGYVGTWNVDRTASIPVCLKHMTFQEK